MEKTPRNLCDVVAAVALVLDANGRWDLCDTLVSFYTKKAPYCDPTMAVGWVALVDWCVARLVDVSCAPMIAAIVRDEIDHRETIRSADAAARKRVATMLGVDLS